MSYDMIDRFLRNNLHDEDYAEFSAALDAVIADAAAAHAQGLRERIAELEAQRVPLTDEQIATIVRLAIRGSAMRRDGLTSHRIARAIERAHGIEPTNQRESA